MSSYADKRSSQASCAGSPNCPSYGSLLRLRYGRPDWFCQDHAELIDKEVKSR